MHRLSRTVPAVALILAPLLVAACAERDAPPAGAGANAPAQRVLSLIPSPNERSRALGGGPSRLYDRRLREFPRPGGAA